MSVTDQYVLNEVIYKTLENGSANANGTLLTQMLSITEIIDSMNRVQQAFMLDTGMIVKRVVIGGAIGVNRYDLPTDSIRPRRITWITGALGYGQAPYGASPYGEGSTLGADIKALTRVDTWELDNGMNDWPSDLDIPIAWWETTLPQQQIGIAKAPLNIGDIGLLYVALATTLTGAGITLTVPDDWSPYILYGTLNELLSSDGPSYDPVRAKYCRQRYDEGVELARLVLGGK